MTDEKKFKARVRERMSRTGESYTTAKRNLDTERNQSSSSHEEPAMPRVRKSTAQVFAERRTEFRKRSLDEWRKLIETLANGQTSTSWTRASDIVSVLDRIGFEAPHNHTLFPRPYGGGLDLSGSNTSHEAGCIEILFDSRVTLVRPASLRLFMPGRDPLREWAYFRLETLELPPSGVYEGPNGHDELVIELAPSEYVSSDYWEQDDYGTDDDGVPLPRPRSARRVVRHFRGSFLIVAKGSTYNTINDYDGEHDAVDASVFQVGIEKTIDRLHQTGTYGQDLVLRQRLDPK